MGSPLPIHIPVPVLRLLLLAAGGVHSGFHLIQLHQVLPDGLVLGVVLLVCLLQLAVLRFPLGKGQPALRGEVVFQLAAGHVKLPQLPLVGGLEFLPLALPVDGVHLVVDGFQLPVASRLFQQGLQLLHAGLLAVHAGL